MATKNSDQPLTIKLTLTAGGVPYPFVLEMSRSFILESTNGKKREIAFKKTLAHPLKTGETLTVVAYLLDGECQSEAIVQKVQQLEKFGVHVGEKTQIDKDFKP